MSDNKNITFKCLFLIVVLFSLPLVWSIYEYRLSTINSFWALDRVKMWTVFIDYCYGSEWLSLFLGQTPGVEILAYDERLDWFIRNQTEQIGAEGVHPYNLHGFHPRFIASWGIASYITFLSVVLSFVRISKATKYIFALILLQGISLGIIYLSTISFIFLIFLGVVKKEVTYRRTVCL